MLISLLSIRQGLWKAWSLIILFVMILSGCVEQDLSQKKKPVVTDGTGRPGATTVATQSTMTLPSVVWQPQVATFTDPVLGLAMDVPSNWCIHPRTKPIAGAWSAVSILSSPCLSTAPITLPPCTQIQIEPGPTPINSLDELKEISAPPGSTVFAQQQVDLNTLPALWTETEMGETDTSQKYPILRVMILIGEHSVRVTAYGDLRPAADIIKSIRPVESGTMLRP